MKRIIILFILFFVITNYSFSQFRTIKKSFSLDDFVISPDGKSIAVENDINILIYNIDKGSLIKSVPASVNKSCLSYSPDGKFLAWRNDMKVSIYNIENNSYIKTELSSGDFQFSPIGNLIVTTNGCEHFYSLLDYNNGVVLKNYNGDNNFDISSDGSKILMGRGAFANEFNICTLLPKEKCAKIYLISMDFAKVKFSNTNKYVSLSKDKTILWDLSENTTKVFNTARSLNDLNVCSFSPLDMYLVTSNESAYNKYKIDIYTLEGNLVESIKNNYLPHKICFTANGKYLIFDDNENIKIYETSKLFPNLKLFTKYYDVNYKDYQNDLNTVFEKSKSRNEFETFDEYLNRILEAMSLKKSVDDKYYDLISSLVNGDINSQNSELDKKNAEIQDKINKSIEPVETKITSVGTYNIENNILPVTINGVIDNIIINRDEAKSLKENFTSAIVKGRKRFKYDLKTYELFELTIIHPISKTEYKFGNW
jgi:hypothetical protein